MILVIQQVYHLTSILVWSIRESLNVKPLEVLEDVLASFLQHINMFSQPLRRQMLLVVPALVLHFSGNDQLLFSLSLLMLECAKADCLVEILRERVVQVLELVHLAAVMFTTPVNGADEQSLNQIDA